jgi:hypothetical protein
MKRLLMSLLFSSMILGPAYGQDPSGIDNRDPIRFAIIILVMNAVWVVFVGVEALLTGPKLKKYAIYLQSATIFCFMAGALPLWLDSLFHPIPKDQWLMTLTGIIGILLWLVATVVSQKRWLQNQKSFRHFELKAIVQELFQNGKNVHEAYMVLNAPIDDVQYSEIPFEEIEAIYAELQGKNPKDSDFWSDVRPK